MNDIISTIQLRRELVHAPETMRNIVEEASRGIHHTFTRNEVYWEVLAAKDILDDNPGRQSRTQLRNRRRILEEFESLLVVDDNTGCLVVPQKGMEFELPGSIKFFVRPGHRSDASTIRELVLKMDDHDRNAIVSNNSADSTSGIIRMIEESTKDLPLLLLYLSADRSSPIGLWKAARDPQFHRCAILASGTLPVYRHFASDTDMMQVFVRMISETTNGRLGKLVVRLSSAQPSALTAYKKCGFKVCATIPGCNCNTLGAWEDQIIMARDVVNNSELACD
jgi:hypothetical protein